jgi:hypothetical protein
MSDLHKRKELWSIWWKRNQNNKINPKLTYKKRRLWSNKTETTYKKKRIWTQLTKKKKKIWTDLKKEKNPEQSYKKERTPKLIYKKEKRNWIFSQKKNLLAYEIKKGININKKERGIKNKSKKNIFLKRG